MSTEITEIMLINTRTFITGSLGPGKWSETLEKMGDQARFIFQSRMTPSGWVPFPVVDNVLKTIEESFTETHENILHELGLHNAEANLKATQKLIMKILTIKMVLKLASFLWTGRVRDGGRMVVINTGNTSVICRIEDPPNSTPQWWKYLAGWFQRTIELAGGRNVRSKWTGGGVEFREAAQFEISW